MDYYIIYSLTLPAKTGIQCSIDSAYWLIILLSEKHRFKARRFEGFPTFSLNYSYILLEEARKVPCKLMRKYYSLRLSRERQ